MLVIDGDGKTVLAQRPRRREADHTPADDGGRPAMRRR
jgi:hypothetical protein